MAAAAAPGPGARQRPAAACRRTGPCCGAGLPLPLLRNQHHGQILRGLPEIGLQFVGFSEGLSRLLVIAKPEIGFAQIGVDQRMIGADLRALLAGGQQVKIALFHTLGGAAVPPLHILVIVGHGFFVGLGGHIGMF